MDTCLPSHLGLIGGCGASSPGFAVQGTRLDDTMAWCLFHLNRALDHSSPYLDLFSAIPASRFPIFLSLLYLEVLEAEIST